MQLGQSKLLTFYLTALANSCLGTILSLVGMTKAYTLGSHSSKTVHLQHKTGFCTKTAHHSQWHIINKVLEFC